MTTLSKCIFSNVFCNYGHFLVHKSHHGYLKRFIQLLEFELDQLIKKNLKPFNAFQSTETGCPTVGQNVQMIF
jgi:hypothetical protein